MTNVDLRNAFLKSNSRVWLRATAAAFVAMAAWSALAAQDPKPPAAANPDDEQQAQQMMNEVRSLVLPQQKERARQMIEKFPNTRLAKLAQSFLDEHKRYEEMAAAEDAQKERHASCIREYWTPRYPEGLAPMPQPMRITNDTGEPLLYQVRGPGMEWSHPHTLRVGQTHVFRYPLTLRRIAKGKFVEEDLFVGMQYRFVAPAGGGSPTLIW